MIGGRNDPPFLGHPRKHVCRLLRRRFRPEMDDASTVRFIQGKRKAMAYVIRCIIA